MQLGYEVTPDENASIVPLQYLFLTVVLSPLVLLSVSSSDLQFIILSVHLFSLCTSILLADSSSVCFSIGSSVS